MKAKLKKKWGIRSEFQFWVIMLVFSLAGSSTVYVREPVFDWVGVTADTNFVLKFLLWLAVIFPAYQILFMIWGTLLGQFQFAWWFEKKMLRRMGLYRKGPKDEPPPGAEEPEDNE